jgi:hypothetical protein
VLFHVEAGGDPAVAEWAALLAPVNVADVAEAQALAPKRKRPPSKKARKRERRAQRAARRLN